LVGLSFTIPYIVTTIYTCLRTNLKEHYLKRLFRFINIVGGNFYDENYNEPITDETEYNKVKKQQLWKFKSSILNDNNKEKEAKDKKEPKNSIKLTKSGKPRKRENKKKLKNTR